MSETIQKSVEFIFETKARSWKALTACLAVFHDQATLFLYDEKIAIKTMDPSHASLILCMWEKEKFLKYEIDLVGKPFHKIVLTTDTLTSLFKRFGDDEIISVHSKNKSSSIIISNGIKTYELKSIEEVAPEAKPPKIPYTSTVSIEIQVLKTMIADSKAVQANSAWFEGKDGKLSYETKDDKHSPGMVSGPLLDEFDIEMSNTAFQFEYLEPMLSAVEKYTTKTIPMQLANLKPMHLSFAVEEIGMIEYYLGNFSRDE